MVTNKNKLTIEMELGNRTDTYHKVLIIFIYFKERRHTLALPQGVNLTDLRLELEYQTVHMFLLS